MSRDLIDKRRLDIAAPRHMHRFFSSDIAQTCAIVGSFEGEARPVSAIESSYRDGFSSSAHSHSRDQFTFISHGILTVTTQTSTIIVPQGNAVWIPRGTVHTATASGRIDLYSLYFETADFDHFPDGCAAFHVSDMFPLLISRIIKQQNPNSYSAVSNALLVLFQEELASARRVYMDIPMPPNKRLRKICDEIIRRPDVARPKAELARLGNMSLRTMSRLFQSELQLSYLEWTRMALVTIAITKLSKGVPVSNVAVDLGYESTSAFTAMFRRHTGRRPTDVT